MHNRVWPEVLCTGLRFNFNAIIMIIWKLLNDNECVLYAIYYRYVHNTEYASLKDSINIMFTLFELSLKNKILFLDLQFSHTN